MSIRYTPVSPITDSFIPVSGTTNIRLHTEHKFLRVVASLIPDLKKSFLSLTG